jgi:hypothetical protein
MKKKSWKTTLGGLAVILGGISSALSQFNDGDVAGAIQTLVVALPAGLALLAARDNNVTSEQAGAK